MDGDWILRFDAQNSFSHNTQDVVLEFLEVRADGDIIKRCKLVETIEQGKVPGGLE